MTSSTDKSGPCESEGSCPYERSFPPGLLGQLHQDCPADLSFWCACRILSQARELETECQVQGWDYYEELHARFRRIVEESLGACFPGAQVFWATREKPKPDEMSPPNEGTRPGSRLLNEVIFDLNRNYHAHKLLWILSQFGVGRSHVFTISPTQAGAHLTCHPMVNRDNNSSLTASWEVDVSFSGHNCRRSFCDHLCHVAEVGGPNARQDIAKEISKQIDSWAAGVIWPDQDFRSRLAGPTDRSLADRIDGDSLVNPDTGLAARYAEAVKHMALISLYQENNGFAAMTYLLAPTLKGESASSLVVYWPRSTPQPPLHLLHLLQMILGQNATTILAKERLAEYRKAGLRHVGHTLKNRLDTLQAFIDQLGEAGLVGHTRMLSDLAIILQLYMVDSRSELLTLDKRDRFLEYAEAGPPVDFLARIIRDWAGLVASRQIYSLGSDRFEAWCTLDMHMHLSCASMAHAMKDRDGLPCRLNEAIYRELFFELLLNANRYGYAQPEPGLSRNGLPVVSVRCDLSESHIGGRHVLVLINRVHPGKCLPAELRSEDWRRWPENSTYSFKGPGMAIQLLRRLELGDLFFRNQSVDEETVYFMAGVYLEGLEITATERPSD